jgi:hypothetical protein
MIITTMMIISMSMTTTRTSISRMSMRSKSRIIMSDVIIIHMDFPTLPYKST